MREPHTEPQVRVIRRDEVPSIHSVQVDGRTYDLGLLKNFRKNEYLGHFLPEQGRPSIGWVALKPNEVLETHRHPIPSVIVIAKGHGSVTGSRDMSIGEGDIVCVPPEAPHGFIGGGKDGFWALSLQFEDRGLYEDAHQPLVAFGGQPAQPDHLAQLKDRNESFFRRFMQRPIFAAFADGTYRVAARRARLMAALQVWSDYFHKMLLMRSATCGHLPSLKVFDEHLRDEFSHSFELNQERPEESVAWDAQLEAACSWFVSKMTMLDDIEKAMLVHMVTEKAATGFYGAAQELFVQEAGRHVSAHAEHDCEHERMSEQLFEHIDLKTYQRLCQVQQEGWVMLGIVLDRIHVLGVGSSANPRAASA